MSRRNSMSFFEWEQEQRRLNKAPTAGGMRAPISPGYGNSGRGLIPAGRPMEGNIAGRISYPGSQSQYDTNPATQPQPWIDDVSESNWWSPFQPVWPYGPPGITRPREFNYPVGYNLNYIQPRMQLYSLLRGMRDSWGVLATIISTRQDQLMRIPWTIQRKDKPGRASAGVDLAKKFFRRPDKILSYSQWSRKLLDDLLVLDAPCISLPRDRGGRVMHADVLDGSTIFPLIDDLGRRPQSEVDVTPDGVTYIRRQPAFQQIIQGMPLLDLDSEEIMYVPMRPLPQMPIFGFPPTLQIFTEASEAVRKTLYQLGFWAEGTIPDLIITVPKEWSPRQIAMFQAHFDALLSGNLSLKSKVRFLPGDMKPFDIKNSSGESLWSQRDETLIRLACYAYSVSPTPFVKQTNRSVAQNAQQTAEEEGLYPLMSYWKDDIMDTIIQEKMGYDDIEFIFQPRPEPDQEKAAKIFDIKIKNGEYSINEARDVDGLDPIPGGDAHLIYIGNAVVPLKQAEAGDAMPVQGGTGTSDSGKPAPSSKPVKPKPASGPPIHGALRPNDGRNASKLLDLLSKVSPQELKDAARAATGDIRDFSHLQLHQGNYKKGHVWIQGLNVSIENAKGSRRGERDQKGIQWDIKMPAPYGYIRGTIGADGDCVDCYLGKHPESTTVWVIDQNKIGKKSGKIKGFDEHKVMLCYNSLRKALKDWFKSHFDDMGHDQLGDVTELSMKDFKDWLVKGDLKKPIAGQAGEVVLKAGELAKLDTISQSTNLMPYSLGAPLPPLQRQLSRKRKKLRFKSGPRWKQLAVAH